jgi:hypothetical protein
MTGEQYKERLIEQVITQFYADVDNGDTTAIHELFKTVPETALEGFLPESVLEEFINN